MSRGVRVVAWDGGWHVMDLRRRYGVGLAMLAAETVGAAVIEAAELLGVSAGEIGVPADEEFERAALLARIESLNGGAERARVQRMLDGEDEDDVDAQRDDAGVGAYAAGAGLRTRFEGRL